MNKNLHLYLNHHLAGSIGAVRIIDHLIDTVEEPEAHDFFLQLKVEVERDQGLLKRLLTSAGMETSAPIQVAGKIAARVGFFQFMWEGFEPKGLGLFEGLEMLALGIQGKRLLWQALKEIAFLIPEWHDVDFSRLEKKALSQREDVERWRIHAARETLLAEGAV